METKGIDLTKYRGLCFKANIRGKSCEGRIQVERGLVFLCQDMIGGTECQDRLGFKYSWGILDGSKEDMKRTHVTDFDIVPRDPETYRDWQVGDKVCEDEHRNACYEVILRSGELVIFKDWNNWASNPMTCSEAFTRFGMRLVLTDIEKQIIEESKKSEWEPQDGDIVAWKDKEDNGPDAVSIYKGKDRGYATMLTNGDIIYSPYATFAMNIIRPATEEEKQRLFDAMAKQGKRWNAEKKVVEDIPKPYEFKKGEPVLVRNGSFEKWCIAAYCHPEGTTNRVFVGEAEAFFVEVIPYKERTMHLLGTTEDYKEE